MEENAGGLEKVQEKVGAVEKKVEEVETVVENMEKQVNDGMYDEMRAREARKREAEARRTPIKMRQFLIRPKTLTRVNRGRTGCRMPTWRRGRPI